MRVLGEMYCFVSRTPLLTVSQLVARTRWGGYRSDEPAYSQKTCGMEQPRK
jgi:hypothetical protein